MTYQNQISPRGAVLIGGNALTAYERDRFAAAGYTIMLDLPEPEDAKAWARLQHVDLLLATATWCHEDADQRFARAKAAGCGRVAKVEICETMKQSVGDPVAFAAGVLNTARTDLRRNVAGADVTIVQNVETAPREMSPLFLGPTLHRILEASSHWAATPMDYVCALAMPALSGLTGGRIIVDVSPGFSQPAILYAAICGTPGSNKTGAFKALGHAKRVVEAKIAADHEIDLAVAEMANEVEGGGKAKKGGPARTLLRLQNATAESVMFALSRQPRGLELEIEEMAVVLQQITGAGYTGTAPLGAMFLRGFDGGRYDYTRRSASDEPLLIRNFATPVSIGAQPDVLAEYITSPRRDGGPDRFIFAFPDAKIDGGKPVGFNTDNGMAAVEAQTALADAFLAIYEASNTLAVSDPRTGDAEIRVPFDAAALELFEKWRALLVSSSRSLSGEQVSARMKMITIYVRMAGIAAFCRHVLDKQPLVVNAAIARQVGVQMRMIQDHRHKIERAAFEPIRERRARELARAIVTREAFMFSPVDARRGWGLVLCRTEADMRDALIELYELGWLTTRIGRGSRDPLPSQIQVDPHALRAAAVLMA